MNESGVKRHFQQVCKIFTEQLIVQERGPHIKDDWSCERDIRRALGAFLVFETGILLYSSGLGHKVLVSTGRCVVSRDTQANIWSQQPVASEQLLEQVRSTPEGHRQNENEFRAGTGTGLTVRHTACIVCLHRAKDTTYHIHAVTINNAL